MPTKVQYEQQDNLMPYQGELYLIRRFYEAVKADKYFNELLSTLAWQEEKIFIYGRWVKVPRLMCWYGDHHAEYHYSGVTHKPLSWTTTLTAIRQDIERHCQHRFNSVLANLYRNGQDAMGCHADNEKELGVNPVIASLSLGDTRLFRLRHINTRQKIDLDLEHGDLLIMAGTLQHHWQHTLPKTAKLKQRRINLTFRKIMLA